MNESCNPHLPAASAPSFSSTHHGDRSSQIIAGRVKSSVTGVGSRADCSCPDVTDVQPHLTSWTASPFLLGKRSAWSTSHEEQSGARYSSEIQIHDSPRARSCDAGIDLGCLLAPGACAFAWQQSGHTRICRVESFEGALLPSTRRGKAAAAAERPKQSRVPDQAHMHKLHLSFSGRGNGRLPSCFSGERGSLAQ